MKPSRIKKFVSDHKTEILVGTTAIASAAGATLLTKYLLVDRHLLLEVDPANTLKTFYEGGGVVYETEIGEFMLTLIDPK